MEYQSLAFHKKLAEVFTKGLVAGFDRNKPPAPGELCIEAAISFALGERHSDTPSCVATADRGYALRINDANWSSPQARAEALFPLALAQLGTAGTDRTVWVQSLVLLTVQRILPVALLKEYASACQRVRSLSEAKKVVGDIQSHQSNNKIAINAAAYAFSAVNDTYAAVTYALSLTNAAEIVATHAAANVAIYADRVTSAANYAAAVAYESNAASYVSNAADKDEVLKLSVQCALDAYREAKCSI